MKKKNSALAVSTALLVSLTLVMSPAASAKGPDWKDKPAHHGNKDEDREKDKAEDSEESLLDSLEDDLEQKEDALQQDYEQKLGELEAQKGKLTEEEYEAQKQQLEEEFELAQEALEQESESEEESRSALKEQIKEERKAILEQYKEKKEELKALADELKQQIKELKEDEELAADELYESLAKYYEEAGELAEAIAAQKEAVKRDLRNLARYKELSGLLEQEGYVGVKAYVNGEMPDFPIAPVIKGGTTLVPFRAISEALQAVVTWNADERSVTVVRDGIEIKLFVDEAKAIVNGEEMILQVPAQIMKGNTMVPIRFISEALGAEVQYEGDSQSVVIVDETVSSEPETTETAPAEGAAEEAAPAEGESTETAPAEGESTETTPAETTPTL